MEKEVTIEELKEMINNQPEGTMINVKIGKRSLSIDMHTIGQEEENECDRRNQG